MMRRFGSAAGVALLFIFSLTGCGTLGGHGLFGHTEKGLASWYGEAYQGKTTASGEPFDLNKKTAAHKKLPFGTLVRVKRRDNGRVTIVYINDRGPFVRGRIIDLSKAAAQELDMVRAGLAPVRIKVIRRPRR